MSNQSSEFGTGLALLVGLIVCLSLWGAAGFILFIIGTCVACVATDKPDSKEGKK